MNRFLKMFRLMNCVMGVIGVTVASFMAAGTGIMDEWPNLFVSAVVVFLFIAGGNSLNDSIDVEIDKTSHPDRPVPRGLITVQTARRTGFGLLALACAASVFTFHWEAVAVVLVADVLMVSYELFLKQRGFVGNVDIAVLTGMTFLMGGAVVGHPWDNAIVAMMACLVSIGREISKDIEDMEGDVGRHTLPMAIGSRGAAAVACVFFVLGPILSVYPMVADTYSVLYYVVVAADLLFLYAAAVVFKDPHKAQKTAKFGMLAGLVAFILGVIEVRRGPPGRYDQSRDYI